jgi:hypothetical protein
MNKKYPIFIKYIYDCMSGKYNILYSVNKYSIYVKIVYILNIF